MEPELYMARII